MTQGVKDNLLVLRLGLRERSAAGAAAQLDHLAHGQWNLVARVLRNVGQYVDALGARVVAERFAIEQHIAREGVHPGDGFEQRRLATAVRAHESDDGGGVELKRNAAQDGRAGEARFEVLDF